MRYTSLCNTPAILGGFRGLSPSELIASSLAQTWALFVRHIAHRRKGATSNSLSYSSCQGPWVSILLDSRDSVPRWHRAHWAQIPNRIASASNDAVVLGVIRQTGGRGSSMAHIERRPFRNVIRTDEHTAVHYTVPTRAETCTTPARENLRSCYLGRGMRDQIVAVRPRWE